MAKKIALTSYMTHTGAMPPDPVVVTSVPVPDTTPQPKGALVTLYGFRDALEILSEVRRRAQTRHRHVVTVAMKMDVGELPRPRVGLEAAKTARFLYLNTLAIDTVGQFEPELMDAYKRFNVPWDDPFRGSTFITTAPAAVVYALKRSKVMPALEGAVFRVQLHRPIQFAVVLNPDAKLEMEARSPVPRRVVLDQSVFTDDVTQ